MMKKQNLRYVVLVPILALLAFFAMNMKPSSLQAGDPNKSEEDTTKIAPTPEVITLVDTNKVEKIENPWGWLRWVMDSKTDKDAPMSYGIVEIQVGKSNPLHYHPNCDEYLHVLSGSCEQVVGEKTVTMKAGDIVRIPQGVPHKATAIGNEPMRAIVTFNTGDRKAIILEKGGKD